jgi:hypothetical protein
VKVLSLVAATVSALALSASPASAARVYAGQPSGGSPFQFVMTLDDAGAAVTGFTFHFDVACSTDFDAVDFGSALVIDDLPGTVTLGAHYMTGGAVKRGRLSAEFMGFDRIGDTVMETMAATLSGTVKAGKASGRVAVTFVRRDITTGAVLAQCSRTIPWRALRNPGLVYGGKTNQDEPVVIELTKDRKRVSHAHLGWYALCPSGGGFAFGHDEFDLRSFPLKPGGVFSRTYRFGFADGTTLVQRFAGRVRTKQAVGTYRSDVTIPDASGKETCTSGNVTWKAATG